MCGSYDGFADFLNRQKSSEFCIRFSEIEEICARKLSPSAYIYQGWWSNHTSHPLMKRVLAASWLQYDLDLANQTVCFRRVDASQAARIHNTEKQDQVNRSIQAVTDIKTNYDKVFKHECDGIVTGLDTQDMVSANTIVHLAIRTAKKYPALFLPTFLEDFIRGMPGSKLIQKYDLLHFNNFGLLLRTLKLKSRQYKDLKLKSRQYKDHNLELKDKNLQDSSQRKQYEFLSKYVNLLHGPLENLLNHNILQTLVSYSLLTHTFIASENIQDYVINAYNTKSKEIAVLEDKTRVDSFEAYMREDLRMKINDIISTLHEQRYVVMHDGDVSVTPEYPKSTEHIYDMLKDEKNGKSYTTFQRIVFDRFPLFRLASPCVQIFDNLLDALESKRFLVRKKAYWKSSFSNDQLFATENYHGLMSDIKQQRVESGRIMFFGRRISPELFLDELKSLEYGDLDDDEDQVTRIAGLVLNDATMLQNPGENPGEFDFVVDMKNYNLRPKQEEMMKKLDFRVNSNTLHCKVMINETVTPSVLSKLAGILPAGEQGVVFTCMPVDSAVSDIVANDKTIQIINQDAIRDWCAIAPVTPCRKNSVAMVRYGDNRGKVVLVKSLNYESGLATVDTVPDSQEILVPMGSIEEMLPHISSLDDFEMVTERYLDFLHLLASATQDSFEEAMNTDIVAIYDDLLDLLKKIKPELYDVENPVSNYDSPLYDSKPPFGTKYILFTNVYARIWLPSLSYSECTCKHLLNEDTYQTLCVHLAAGLDRLCREPGDVKTVLKNMDRSKLALRKFRLQNMKRSLDVLYFALDSNGQIEAYLKHVSPDQ